MNYENYPPLPEPTYTDLSVVYSYIADQLREVQRQMARECWRWICIEYPRIGISVAKVIEERFGPFDE